MNYKHLLSFFVVIWPTYTNFSTFLVTLFIIFKLDLRLKGFILLVQAVFSEVIGTDGLHQMRRLFCVVNVEHLPSLLKFPSRRRCSRNNILGLLGVAGLEEVVRVSLLRRL